MFPGGPQAPLRAASGANYASFADVSGGNLVSENTLEGTLKGTHLQRDIYNVTFTEGHLQGDIYRVPILGSITGGITGGITGSERCRWRSGGCKEGKVGVLGGKGKGRKKRP